MTAEITPENVERLDLGEERYDNHGMLTSFLCMVRNAAGEYVRYSDFAALAEKCRRLEEESIELRRERLRAQGQRISAQVARNEYKERAEQAETERDAAVRDAERLRQLIDTPHTDDWFEAVRLEAAHQIKRWGSSHDACKEPLDWFWLLGHLGGKAARAALEGDSEKAKHHAISSSAMLLNWFRAMVGDNNSMRPGMPSPVSPPKLTKDSP